MNMRGGGLLTAALMAATFVFQASGLAGEKGARAETIHGEKGVRARTDLSKMGTFAFSRPKVDFTSLRWAFRTDDDMYQVELSCRQDMIVESWMERNEAAWGDTLRSFRLNKEEMTRLAPFLPEVVGQDYWVLVPERCEWQPWRLSGFMIEADALADWRVLGILSPQGKRPHSAGPGSRSLAISTPTPMVARPMRPDITPPSKEYVIEAVRRVSGSDPTSISAIEPLFLKYPDEVGWYAIVRMTDKLQLLYCFRPFVYGKGLDSLPFECEKYLLDREGFIFENTDTETEYNMVDPHIAVLPDLNGNASNELFITSRNQAYLLDVTPGGGRVEMSYVMAE